MKQDEAIELVKRELDIAVAIHGPFRSWHEGVSVIHEEYDELWGEVKKVRSFDDQSNYHALLKEAKQLAAMAIRFMVDLC